MSEFIFSYHFLLPFHLVLLIISVLLFLNRIKSWKVKNYYIILITNLFKKDFSLKNKIKAIIDVMVNDFLALKRAGALCEENLHFYGRFLTLYGFLGVAILNVLNFLINPMGMKLGFYNLITILSYAANSSLTIGAAMLIYRRMSRINLRRTTDSGIWILQSLLLLFGLTNMIFMTFYNLGLTFESLYSYIAYIAVIAMMYIYFPLSEAGYFAWKAAHLLSHSLTKQEKVKI